jgi:uncharacterized protein with von Willebrand factor type A (vWA) domain
MSYLDKIVGAARALRGKLVNETDTGKEVNAIKHDRFDGWAYESLLDEVPVIKDDIRDLGMKHDQVPDFMEDMFNMLHQGDPKARQHKDMDAKHKANVDLANHFLELPDVLSLRHHTMFDKYATAMGMRSLKEAIREAYERTESARQQYQDAEQARKDAEGAAQILDGLIQQASGMGEDDPNAEAMGQAIEDAMKDLAQAMGVSEQALADAMAAAEQAAQDAEQAVGQAAKDAKQDLEDERDRARAFGVEPGELQRMPFAERAALAQKLSRVRDVDAFAKMVGQGMNVEVGEFRQKVTNTPDEITNVRLSNDLTHLTSPEYMNLAIPEMETDFWRRYSEGRLLTYELSGRERQGKGPIIVIRDESGSMQGAREQFAAALTMALCQRCKRDKRDFHYIGFSSTSQQYHKEFPNGQASVDDVIDVVTHFFNGGTYYEGPLKMAREIVQDYHEKGKDKPDIVFITDDAYRSLDDTFMEEWKRAKNVTEMRVFGILLGGGSTEGPLEQISDNVRTLDDVSTLDGTRDIFRVL